ncbi:UNVERIFIED_ORG: hypothetical protein FHU01_4435 [Citrobacter freundii]
MHRGVHVEGLFGQQCLIHENGLTDAVFDVRLEQVGPQHHDGGAFFNNCLNDFKPDEFFIYLT